MQFVLQGSLHPALHEYYLSYNIPAHAFSQPREAAMHVLKLTQIGNSVGVILPKEMLARLKVEKGEQVFLTETPDGYAITPYDPEIEKEIELGLEFMNEFRETFKALAK
jgi:putative addiction module antidote